MGYNWMLVYFDSRGKRVLTRYLRSKADASMLWAKLPVAVDQKSAAGHVELRDQAGENVEVTYVKELPIVEKDPYL
jgi:hypothetical protein